MNKSITPSTPLHFRDANGHVDPRYAAHLEALSRESAEPRIPLAFSKADISGDSIAEELGEEFVRTATSGEEDASDLANAEQA